MSTCTRRPIRGIYRSHSLISLWWLTTCVSRGLGISELIWFELEKQQLETVAINDALPLKPARRDAIAKLKSCWASNLSCRQTHCRFINSFRVAVIPWSVTFMPLRACAMDWGRNRIPRVSKNSGPIVRRIWTKVHEILGHVGDPLYFPMSLPDCLCDASFRRYSPLGLQVVQKQSKCKGFWAPNCLGRVAADFSAAGC